MWWRSDRENGMLLSVQYEENIPVNLTNYGTFSKKDQRAAILSKEMKAIIVHLNNTIYDVSGADKKINGTCVSLEKEKLASRVDDPIKGLIEEMSRQIRQEFPSYSRDKHIEKVRGIFKRALARHPMTMGRSYFCLRYENVFKALNVDKTDITDTISMPRKRL